jgi:hypothetical protein
MPRKDATCKKCNQSLRGHLKKKICPSEHGHIQTEEGKYTCSHKSCLITFTTLSAAHKHSTSKSCPYFEGEETPIYCPNGCGSKFTGTGAKSNAIIHSTTTMCSNHPDRINNPDYRTAITHAVIDDKKYCSGCKIELSIDQFANKKNSKNGTNLDHYCYKCRAIWAMRQGVIKRATKEGNDSKEITLEYIKSLVTTHCPVFDIPLQYGGADQCDNSATIDAITHHKGHIMGNLRIISKKANTIKNNSTVEEMEMLVNVLQKWESPITDEIAKPNRIKGTKTTKEDTHKVCSLCKEQKSLDMFHKSDSATILGIANKCISCTALSSMIKNAKQRCKKSGRIIDIDDYYLLKLTKGLVYCPILGIKMVYGGTGSIQDNSASIDRFDTTQGYIKGNVWIISDKANRMKSNATLDDIKRVYDYMKVNTLI